MRSLSVVVALLASAPLTTPRVRAQAPAAPSPAFEVASVKPSAPDATGMLISGPTPGAFLTRNAPLARLIMYAFGMREEQLVGVPGWARTERFDITGKYSPGQTPSAQDVALMTRSLLEDRFRLQTHGDVREGPTYTLVLARRDRRLGPRLKPTTIDDCAAYLAAKRAAGEVVSFGGRGDVPACMGVTSDRFIKMNVRTMANLAAALASRVGRPVIDQTGLAANFEFNVEWTPGLTAAIPSNDVPISATPDDSVSLFTALEEQLGLKLESTTAPIDVLVIDHVEHPTPD